jgi:hypothetical protein
LTIHNRIVDWAGDPETRSGMSFLTLVLDGKELWLPYGMALSSDPFRCYCERNAPLLPPLYGAQGWKLESSSLDKKPIESVVIGSESFVDLRAWGWNWFHQCGLPNERGKNYTVCCKYIQWENKLTRVQLYCPLFRQSFV